MSINLTNFHYSLLKNQFKKARSTKIQIVDVVNDLEWHPTRKWKIRKPERIDTVVLHAADTYATLKQINHYDISPGNHISKKGCPHFTYHFYITYPNGTIYQANRLTDIVWHARGANTRGIGIALQGKFFCFKRGNNFERYSHSHLGLRQKRTDPTNAQIVSVIQLLDYLRFKIPTITRFLGHCDVSPITRRCDPGDTAYYLLQVYKEILR